MFESSAKRDAKETRAAPELKTVSTERFNVSGNHSIYCERKSFNANL